MGRRLCVRTVNAPVLSLVAVVFLVTVVVRLRMKVMMRTLVYVPMISVHVRHAYAVPCVDAISDGFGFV